MAMIMSEADWCLTGADSISNTGSVANKIGTYQLALLAEKHEKPLYVATEIMKLQTDTIEGYPIHLERRPPDEILDITGGFDFPDRIKVVHQFFDLTPASYIRALITEQGIVSPATIGMAWSKFESMFNGVS
jgi:methylthioribose-1-phosphate isomerase